MGITHGPGRVATGLLAGLLVAGLLAGGGGPASAAEQPFDGGRTTISGASAPMDQTDGPVWAVEVAGGRVWAGGEFTSTRPAGVPAGSQESSQAYLAAFDSGTGARVASFDPVLTNEFDGATAPTVWTMALSGDGTVLYVGGDFTHVDGVEVRRIAAFDTATGDLLSPLGSHSPGVNGSVTALAVSPDGSTLYAGGKFSTARFESRTNLAALDTATGQVLAWDPTISGAIESVGGQAREALRVVSLAVSGDGDRVFLAGPFREVNDTPMQGFAATSAADGELVRGFRPDYLAVPFGWGTALETVAGDLYLGARDDGTRGGSRREGVYSLDDATAAEHWYANCYGDTFGLQALGDELYVASHAHDCSDAGGQPETGPRTYLAIHALNRSDGRVKPYFVQTSGGTQKTRLLSRALATDGRQLVMGGGFARLNGDPQANLTRFRSGSALPEAAPRPRVRRTCQRCAGVRISFPTTFDRDDVSLRYLVHRNQDTSRPIRRLTRTSVVWSRSTMTFVDRSAPRGRRVTYRVRVVDPSGRSRLSARSSGVWVPRR